MAKSVLNEEEMCRPIEHTTSIVFAMLRCLGSLAAKVLDIMGMFEMG